MNKKLIVAAVSAAVVAPVAAYGEVTVYGRINNVIDINDLDDSAGAESNTDISGIVSRFGVKYNGEIGNGLTAHGQYEFGTTSDKEKASETGAGGVEDIRVASVGLSGAFGRVDIGNQWSAYFNTFGTLVSPTYSLGYYIYSSIGGAPYRTSNTIKYSNSFGPVSAQLDVRLNDSDETAGQAEKIRGNGIGLGLSFAVTDNITIAAAFDSEDGADNNSGVVQATAVRELVAPDTIPNDNVGAGEIFTAAQQAAYAALADADADKLAIKQDAFIKAAVASANAAAVDAPTVTAGGDAVDPPFATDQIAGYVSEAGNPQYRIDNDSPDTDRIGIAVKANFGGYWASLGWQNYQVDDNENTLGNDEIDRDTTFIYGGGNLGEKTNWLIGYSEADDGRDAVARVLAKVDGDPNTAGEQPRYGSAAVTGTGDSSQLTWGVYHNIGGGLKLYYEAMAVDSENNEQDGARHLLGMRVDF